MTIATLIEKLQEDISWLSYNETEREIIEHIKCAITLLKEQEKKKFLVDSDGKITPLPDVVRCKECIHRGKAEKCVLAAIAAEKDFPLFMLDNRGEWYCADGKREAEEEKTERNEENVR